MFFIFKQNVMMEAQTSLRRKLFFSADKEISLNCQRLEGSKTQFFYNSNFNGKKEKIISDKSEDISNYSSYHLEQNFISLHKLSLYNCIEQSSQCHIVDTFFYRKCI